jgi:tRNA modification GTPase
LGARPHHPRRPGPCDRRSAGKSSLLNALVGEDRAIVSPLPGTTRDTIEETFAIDGVPVRVIDTAGMRASDDPIERIGIERAHDALGAATLALLVVDGSAALDENAREILTRTRDRRRLVFFNKRDLGTHAYDTRDTAEREALSGSALDAGDLDALRAAIARAGWDAQTFDFTRPHLASARHAHAVARAREALAQADATLVARAPTDLVAGDLLAACAALAEISGGAATEALLDGIFARFCIGK